MGEELGNPENRTRPNILITGAPGTGKSTLAEQLAQRLHFDYIDIAKEIREQRLFSEYDERLQSHVLDEDKLLDHLAERLDSKRGGCVLDYHGSDFFPERWFDTVAVLRCDNRLLYDRLAARGYSQPKIKENIECEIFGSLLEEARDAYPEERIVELRSDNLSDLAANLTALEERAEEWKRKRANVAAAN